MSKIVVKIKKSKRQDGVEVWSWEAVHKKYVGGGANCQSREDAIKSCFQAMQMNDVPIRDVDIKKSKF